MTVLTYCDFLESLVRIAMVKALDLFALIVTNTIDLGDLPDHPPKKWLDSGFRPECDAVNRLAQKGCMKWRAEDVGDRVDILIRGIKYMLETNMDWHLNTKFKKISSKAKNVLESTRNAKKSPKTTKLQLFEPDGGKAMLPFNETGHVHGITISKQASAAMVNVFGNKHKQHKKAKGGGFMKKFKKRRSSVTKKK